MKTMRSNRCRVFLFVVHSLWMFQQILFIVYDKGLFAWVEGSVFLELQVSFKIVKGTPWMEKYNAFILTWQSLNTDLRIVTYTGQTFDNKSNKISHVSQ